MPSFAHQAVQLVSGAHGTAPECLVPAVVLCRLSDFIRNDRSFDADNQAKVNAMAKNRRKSAGPAALNPVFHWSFEIRVLPAHQTRHEFAGYIGVPFLQPKALPNSSKFWTLPLTLHLPGECGSVSADWRADASVSFSHQTCAKPIK